MQVLREKIDFPPGQSFRVIRWSRNLREVECVLAPGRAQKIAGEGTHWHYHTEMELTLFTSGAGMRFVGDHIGGFAGGDLVLLGAKLPHYWHAKEASSGISVQWHFPESHPFWAFPETLKLAGLFKRAGRGVRFSGRSVPPAAGLMQEITTADGVERLALLLKLLALLSRVPEQERTFLSVRSFVLPLESHYQQAVRDAVRHLIAHFRQEVRLEDVLELTGLSRATFARQFKKHAGRSFSEFLNRLRLHAACRELVESPRGVLDIAGECGFTQISFFNRLFRREHGCSPTEYRRRKGERSA